MKKEYYYTVYYHLDNNEWNGVRTIIVYEIQNCNIVYLFEIETNKVSIEGYPEESDTELILEELEKRNINTENIILTIL